LQFQWWRFPRVPRRAQRSRTLPRHLMRRSLLVCLGHYACAAGRSEQFGLQLAEVEVKARSRAASAARGAVPADQTSVPMGTSLDPVWSGRRGCAIAALT
jgi:hypothetical protein